MRAIHCICNAMGSSCKRVRVLELLYEHGGVRCPLIIFHLNSDFYRPNKMLTNVTRLLTLDLYLDMWLTSGDIVVFGTMLPQRNGSEHTC